MLVFVDQAKSIKVLRAEQGASGMTRVRLGVVKKNKMELSDELKASLNKDELKEVEGAITLYQQADESQKKVDVLRFPQIVREVIEYVSTGDVTELERRIILTSFVDGLRQIRKLERGEATE
jgi:hypothetical protein